MAAIHSYDHIPNLASVDTRYIAWNNPALAKVRVKIKKHRYRRSQRGKAIKELNDLDLQYQKAYVNDCINKIQVASDGKKTRVAYQIINQVTGRKVGKRATIEANSPDERLSGWATYFEGLLNVKADDVVDESQWEPENPFIDDKVHECPIIQQCATIAELDAAIKQMSNNKACGIDGITTEYLKIPGISAVLLPIINKVLESCTAPAEWRTNIIVPVPKKGDLTKYDNYRGISLMSIVGKVYNRILLNRLQRFIDPLLDHTQNGFRRGRATTGHILALRRIIEEYDRHGKHSILTFIDFKKAFDSINRSRMKNT